MYKKLSTLLYLVSVGLFVAAIVCHLLKILDNVAILVCCGSVFLCFGGILLTRTYIKKTVNYYNQNAQAFFENTENADMSETRDKFTALVKEGGRILDWGCGSGRDALAFLQAGFHVVATDASEELCKLASEKTGLKVRCEEFSQLIEEKAFDGIWACASLLHLEKDMLFAALNKADYALKPEGVMYMSFKYGKGQRHEGDRFFLDMTEKSMKKIIRHYKHFTIHSLWVSDDVRPDRNEKWLNVILIKNK